MNWITKKILLYVGRYFCTAIGGLFAGIAFSTGDIKYLIIAFPLLFTGGTILERMTDNAYNVHYPNK